MGGGLCDIRTGVLAVACATLGRVLAVACATLGRVCWTVACATLGRVCGRWPVRH